MIAALLGVLAILGGTQDTPARPIARWSLQVEAAHCALVRLSPETGSTFSIDATPGSDSYRLAIKKEGVDASESFKPASLTFAPSQKVTTGLARVAKLPNRTVVTLMQGLPASLLDDLSGASTVTLEAKGLKTIVPVPGAAKAVEALRKCNADQLVEWGADPAQFALGGTTPIALKSRDEWISNSVLLNLAGESGRSTINDEFRLLVASDGVIAECHATAAITEKSLEKHTCAAVVGRRLFSPAKDASGNAVVGAATFTISLIRGPS